MATQTPGFIDKPLYELAVLIRSGRLSPLELVEASIERIDHCDAALRAFITVYRHDALKQARILARELSVGTYRGVLHGIPVGIKDNLYTQDRVTTMGSRIHGSFVPNYNATVVDRLVDAGAIIIGKQNMHEYALGGSTDNPFYGTCRNPWNLNYSPGGSSGGSAVATATHMVAASIGTDTSGSIRVPASYCGVVGVKPSYGRVSRHGCFPEAWSLDHVGPITRNVRDAAILLDVISGSDAQDQSCLGLPSTELSAVSSTDIAGLAIGIEEGFFFRNVDSAIARCVGEAVDALRDRGATISSITIPWLAECKRVLDIIDATEAVAIHRDNYLDRPGDFGSDVRQFIEAGLDITTTDYLDAQRRRKQLKLEMAAVFNDVDVLVTPTVPSRTPAVGATHTRIDAKSVDAGTAGFRCVEPASLLGLPSLSMPCGWVDEWPVGLQVIGPDLGEDNLIRVGLCLEEVDLFNGCEPMQCVLI